MFQLKAATISDNPDPMECYLDLVLGPLRQTGTIPAQTPQTRHPEYITLEALEHLTLERDSSGWTFVLSFSTPRNGMPNSMSLASGLRPDNAMAAFLLGAFLICEIGTGCPNLPFLVEGDTIYYATFG